MSELGDVAKGAMGALEKAKAFDAKTEKLYYKDVSDYNKEKFLKKLSSYHNQVEKHFKTLIPNFSIKKPISLNMDNYREHVGKLDDHLLGYEDYAQDHLHYTPEQHELHRKILKAINPNFKTTFDGNFYGIRNIESHMEPLSRLNPQQQEIYLGLLPGWHDSSGSLEDAARNL